MGIYSYLKLHRKERSRKKDLRSHLGIKIGTSGTEVLTECANPSSGVKGLNKIKFMALTVRGYGSTRVTPALDLQRCIIRITFPVHKLALHT